MNSYDFFFQNLERNLESNETLNITNSNKINLNPNKLLDRDTSALGSVHPVTVSNCFSKRTSNLYDFLFLKQNLPSEPLVWDPAAFCSVHRACRESPVLPSQLPSEKYPGCAAHVPFFFVVVVVPDEPLFQVNCFWQSSASHCLQQRTRGVQCTFRSVFTKEPKICVIYKRKYFQTNVCLETSLPSAA